jgi:glucose-6-phosphate 1-dehydrogenase
VSAVIEVNPLEQFSREPAPAGDSCLLIIFGASGDLTHRKLIPGLYNLACVGCMNPQFEVLGVGRTPMTSEEFRSKLRESTSKSGDARDFNENHWSEFANRLHYFPGDINDDQFYTRLRDQLDKMQTNGSSPNRLF